MAEPPGIQGRSCDSVMAEPWGSSRDSQGGPAIRETDAISVCLRCPRVLIFLSYSFTCL